MGRPLKIDRSIQKNTMLPESLVAEVDVLLWSELEGKVPHGAWQEYLVGLIRKDLEARRNKQQGAV